MSSPESIGQRIARLRQQHGYTQQTLADRLAISRVAVSHIEAGLNVPSERTITLLAGLFKCVPYELVEGTTYPQAKAERLPITAAWYTELELEIALLKNDLGWLGQVQDNQRIENSVLRKWEIQLRRWEATCLDEREQELLAEAQKWLQDTIVTGRMREESQDTQGVILKLPPIA